MAQPLPPEPLYLLDDLQRGCPAWMLVRFIFSHPVVTLLSSVLFTCANLSQVNRHTTQVPVVRRTKVMFIVILLYQGLTLWTSVTHFFMHCMHFHIVPTESPKVSKKGRRDYYGMCGHINYLIIYAFSLL